MLTYVWIVPSAIADAAVPLLVSKILVLEHYDVGRQRIDLLLS
jgi:hypothetical protein